MSKKADKVQRVKIPYIIRYKVYQRDGFKCLHPECNETNVKKLTIDHINPIELGGLNEKENYQTLCRSHNSSKGIKVIDYRIVKDF